MTQQKHQKKMSVSLAAAEKVYKNHGLGDYHTQAARRATKAAVEALIKPRRNKTKQSRTERTNEYIKDLHQRKQTRNLRLHDRPKKIEELPVKERDRLQQLFAIYAEHTSHSFRHPVGKIPNNNNNNNNSTLPSLPTLTNDADGSGSLLQVNPKDSKDTDVTLPSINNKLSVGGGSG